MDLFCDVCVGIDFECSWWRVLLFVSCCSAGCRPWDKGGGQSSRPLDRGGGCSHPKKFLEPFRPHFSLKIRRGRGVRAPRGPPLDSPLCCTPLRCRLWHISCTLLSILRWWSWLIMHYLVIVEPLSKHAKKADCHNTMLLCKQLASSPVEVW